MNKKVLITGATDGIGKQTALDLAFKGYHILLHGRSREKCLEAKNYIEKETGSENISYFAADFNSLVDVKLMTEEINQTCGSIDVLINNAGVYMTEKELTSDGYEKTFAINHLAHFLLTDELLDLIKKSPAGRIITVSSIAHRRGSIDFSNLNSENYFDPYNSYSMSKLCNVLFSNKLAQNLRNSGVTSNSLHPGVINTKLLRKGFNIQGAETKSGAVTSVYLASSDMVEGITGNYFDNSMAIPSSKITYDTGIQEELWQTSKKMIQNVL